MLGVVGLRHCSPREEKGNNAKVSVHPNIPPPCINVQMEEFLNWRQYLFCLMALDGCFLFACHNFVLLLSGCTDSCVLHSGQG